MSQSPHSVCATLPARFGAFGQRGLTLIEILVTIVLLAVGLLGLAGLQLRGMQVNQGSQLRSQAAVLAEDLADRMRADPANTSAGNYFGAFTTAAPDTFAPVTDWWANVAAMPAGVSASADLPAACKGAMPCAVIQGIAGGPPTPVQIGIYWNDARAANAANAAGAKGTAPASQVGSFLLLTALANNF